MRTENRYTTEDLRRLKTYFRWLRFTRLDFHLDEDPDDILWGFPITESQFAFLKREHDWMFSTFDSTTVWNLFADIVMEPRGDYES